MDTLYASIKSEDTGTGIMALPADLRCIAGMIKLIDAEMDPSAPKQDILEETEKSLKETEKLRQEAMGK